MTPPIGYPIPPTTNGTQVGRVRLWVLMPAGTLVCRVSFIRIPT